CIRTGRAWAQTPCPPNRRLTLEAARVEERLLLGRRRAAEDRVAMRESAEAADDVAVLFGAFQACVVRRAVELDAALLIVRVFRMYERQEEKAAHVLRDVLIVAALERAVGDLTRARIGRIGARVAAEHVARELLEHDAERKRAVGGRLPIAEFAGRRRLISGEEFLAHFHVERVV